MMLKRKEKTGEIPNLGMYVHVPFCSTTCDFCAFYQERPSKKGFDLFFNGLEREIEHFSQNRSFSTIFIGGGTPGLLNSEQLGRLGALIHSQNLSDPLEWSIEIAPSEISIEKLETLSKFGVNRISLGVQTFHPQLMKELGRMHEVETALQAYSMIREVGFSSVNLDLIFGIPGQTLEMWEKDLAQAVELQPDHLSTYCLTFEEDTALFIKLSNGKIKLDPEREITFYEKAWDFLPTHGYEQYEVSNFAKDGHICQHNLNTWAMNDWIGFGPSAATQLDGIRRKNFANLEKWAQQWNQAKGEEFEEFEPLNAAGLAHDAITFGLRMNRGISLNGIARKFDLPLACFKPIESFLNELQTEGLVEKNDFWRLNNRGRILADAVAREMPVLS